jgi:hypothetical protein
MLGGVVNEAVIAFNTLVQPIAGNQALAEGVFTAVCLAATTEIAVAAGHVPAVVAGNVARITFHAL